MSTLFEDGLFLLKPASSHRHTPTLTAVEPRGLAVRVVGYLRESNSVTALVNRTVHDSTGRAIAQWDPRLFLNASAPANLQTVYALSGTVLSTNSVDAGWRVALLGEAGQVVHQWDGRGSQRWAQYDTHLRPVSVFEQPLDGEAVCTERLSYGASDQASAEHNQCGQLIRHDDPAGTQRFIEFGLHGAVLAQARHFLRDLAMPNWPESIADRELLLEPGEGAITFSRFNATGEAIEQTVAKGHRQLFSQNPDGQLREVGLQISGESTAKTLVSAIAYNAHGQTEREVAGNGVITSLQYDAADGRLTRLQAKRGNKILQDLLYAYDPVGNVLSIEDAALPIRYFANQRIEPISCYCYDTLYQLIEATGWEAGAANKGPSFSTFADPSPVAHYRQRYRYDQGGNLLQLTHEGPQSHGHRLVAATHSNRCLPVLAGVEPDEGDFRRGFDANGNLLDLQLGQALGWDLRNQLLEVRPVERDSGLNDSERYVYGADGMRLRKVRALQTNARTLIPEVRYLPNLELRTHSGTGEVLQAISVQAGHSSVRVLHWESEPPKDSANDQYRYSLNDHLGSCTLELDDAGEVISQERYHPFGTTAWFAGRGEVEASYKTVRYSGKERDATGLYYYGFRYYVPWLQRWVNPDPAGTIDGLNFFGYVKSNPQTLIDAQGLNVIDINDLKSRHKQAIDLEGALAVPIKMLHAYDVVEYESSKNTTKVSNDVYKSLKQAHVTNLMTKRLIFKGSGNQRVDVMRATEDLNDLISKIRPEYTIGGHDVSAILESGAGNCFEHAAVAFNLLASTKTKEPVFHVRAYKVDHSFVVIGDKRQISGDKLVIVDPWPVFPLVHTARDGVFEIGDIYNSASAEADLKYAIDDAWLNIHSGSRFLNGGGPLADARQKYEWLISQDKIFTQLFSRKQERERFDYMNRKGEVGRFYALPKSYVEDRMIYFTRYPK